MRFIISICICLISIYQSSAQGFGEGAVSLKYNRYKYPSLGAGAGISAFHGDLKNKEYAQAINFTAVYSGFIEQRIGKFIGISADVCKGSLSQDLSFPNTFASFRSDLTAANVHCMFFFDNGRIFRSTAIFAPYIFGGVGYMLFNPMADWKDAYGQKYYYWNIDASLRDKPFDIQNPTNGNVILRDYKYESTLDSLNLFEHSSLTIPVGIGLKCKLSDIFEVRVQSTYYLTQTDAIDNIYGSNPLVKAGNDAYLYTSVSLQFNFGGKAHPMNLLFANVDFNALENSDADMDGVRDMLDDCGRTPAGVKVNKQGCPVDTDNDGVPDYRDTEPASPKNAIVDGKGKTITEAMMQEELLNDSLKREGLIGLEVEYRKRNDTIPLKRNTSIENYRPPTNSKKGNKSNSTESPKLRSVTYSVQITSLSQPGQEERVAQLYSLTDPVFAYQYMTRYKYSVGSFAKWSEANKYSEAFRAKFNVDCFVIAIQNGVIIPVAQAKKITKE